MADEPNGRSRVNWTTFFAGCGLILTVGSVVVYAMIAQWSAQFAGVHSKITAEREITELKIKLSKEEFRNEFRKTQEEQKPVISSGH